MIIHFFLKIFRVASKIHVFKKSLSPLIVEWSNVRAAALDSVSLYVCKYSFLHALFKRKARSLLGFLFHFLAFRFLHESETPSLLPFLPVGSELTLSST